MVLGAIVSCGAMPLVYTNWLSIGRRRKKKPERRKEKEEEK